MTTNYYVVNETEFYNEGRGERRTYVVVDAETGNDLGLVDEEFGGYEVVDNDNEGHRFRTLKDAAEFLCGLDRS